jgi:hypothetical protein
MSMNELPEPRNAVEAARQDLQRLIPLAISTLHDLAINAERENVRLSAAEAILDRSGLARGATLHVTTDQEQHREAERAALDLVERLERNRVGQGASTRPVALEALVVLEGVEPDELPIAAVPENGIIDVD